MSEEFDIPLGSLWRFRRRTQVVGQAFIKPDDIGMVVSSSYQPFERKNGSIVPRWSVTILSKDKIFDVRKASRHIWHFYFERVDDGVHE